MDTQPTRVDVMVGGIDLLDDAERDELGIPNPTTHRLTQAGDGMRNAIRNAGRKQQRRAAAGVR